MPRAKSNRTDLNTPKVPVTTSPGQEYGKRTAQEQAQRMIPMASGPPMSPTGGTPPPAAQAPPQAQAPQPFAPPGSLPFLHPTNRPNEPLTTGLPTGPGAGPEALTGFAKAGYQNMMNTNGTAKQLLTHLASQPAASSIIQQLASTA